MKLPACLLLSVVTLFVAGCGSTPVSWCDGKRPILVTEQERQTLSDETVLSILSHNDKGARLCGWTPQ